MGLVPNYRIVIIMMIKRIQIKDYRSCLSTSFELNPHLSILIGPNGSGKTNILNAITLLHKLAEDEESIYRRLEERPEGQCNIKVWFEIDGKNIIFSAVVGIDTDENNSDEIVYSRQEWYLENFTGNKKRLTIPLSIARHLDAIGSENQEMHNIHIKRQYYRQIYQTSSRLGAIPDLAKKAILKIDRYVYDMKYYSASQFTNPSNCPISFEIEKEGPRRRGFRLGGHNHTKFLYDLYTQYTTPNNASYQQYVEIVGPNGLGLVDKIEFEEILTSSIDYSVRVGGKVKKRAREKSLIIPGFTIGKHKLSPNQLSEGTFKTITLLFYLITESSSILLVEEPEVCIHHGLLSSIIELIKTYSKDKQIVVSTHSDFVLDHVNPENVYKVSIAPDLGTKVASIPQSMSRSDFKALREYLDKVGNLGEYWKHGALE